jgi:predicted O-methyltransferase YrrM
MRLKRVLKRYLGPQIVTAAILVGRASARYRLARGQLDLGRLERRRPPFSALRAQRASIESELHPYFQEYTRTVSSDGMAISLETAVLCLFLARVTNPRSIADLGSGFSSFVFRYHASHTSPRAAVFSVDDSEAWLAKTKSYLEAKHLPSDHLLRWEDFKDRRERFDLILHDLGNRVTRAEALPYVIEKARPGAVIVLDDFHKGDYATVALRFFRRARKRVYLVPGWSLDQFGRYSAIVIN